MTDVIGDGAANVDGSRRSLQAQAAMKSEKVSSVSLVNLEDRLEINPAFLRVETWGCLEEM